MQRLLIVPPGLAYGSKGVQEIPPNATIEVILSIYFSVTLVSTLFTLTTSNKAKSAKICCCCSWMLSYCPSNKVHLGKKRMPCLTTYL